MTSFENLKVPSHVKNYCRGVSCGKFLSSIINLVNICNVALK